MNLVQWTVCVSVGFSRGALCSAGTEGPRSVSMSWARRGGDTRCTAWHSANPLSCSGSVPLPGLDKHVCLKSQCWEAEAAGSELGMRFVHLSYDCSSLRGINCGAGNSALLLRKSQAWKLSSVFLCSIGFICHVNDTWPNENLSRLQQCSL